MKPYERYLAILGRLSRGEGIPADDVGFIEDVVNGLCAYVDSDLAEEDEAEILGFFTEWCEDI